MNPDRDALSLSPLEQQRRIAAQRADYLDLSSSNPTHHRFIFPPDILRACADEYWRTRRYEPDPKGSLRAREAIAQYYMRRTPPLDVSPERIFITASTSEAYALLFALLCAPEETVLAPIPSYPLFAHLADMQHITLRHYALDALDAGGDALRRAMDAHTRALLLISPHNPTGHVITAASSLGAIGDTTIPWIADEVFCEFPFALESVPPVGALFPAATVFHLNGISKMFALPDLKLGWIALSGPRADEYVERLELLNDTLLGANALTQVMLPALFERGWPFVEHMRAAVRRNLLAALDELRAMPRVTVAPPSAGIYLFPQIAHCADEDALLARMLAAGLFAQPGYFYDVEQGCHLVISGLLAEEQLRAGLRRLSRVLAEA